MASLKVPAPTIEQCHWHIECLRERGARRAEAERRERAEDEAPEGTEALPA